MFKVKFVYLIFPVLVIYNIRLVSKGFAGTCFGPVIAIDPKHRESKSLLGHELVHSRQVVRTLGLHYLLYKYSKIYKLRAEIEAYHVQVKERKYNKYIIAWVVKVLFNMYKLNMTKDEIEDEVFEYYERKKAQRY